MRNIKKHVLMSTTANDSEILVENFKPLFEKQKNRNIKIKILTQLNNQTKKFIGKIKKIEYNSYHKLYKYTTISKKFVFNRSTHKQA